MSKSGSHKDHNLIVPFKDRHEFRMIRQAYFFIIGFDYTRQFTETISMGGGGTKQYLKFNVTDEEKAQILSKYDELKRQFERSREKALDNLLTEVMTRGGVMPQDEVS